MKKFMYIFVFLLLGAFQDLALANIEEITPYKFQGSYKEELSKTSYVIPASSRFSVSRNELFDAPEIVYYFTKPHNKNETRNTP